MDFEFFFFFFVDIVSIANFLRCLNTGFPKTHQRAHVESFESHLDRSMSLNGPGGGGVQVCVTRAQVPHVKRAPLRTNTDM